MRGDGCVQLQTGGWRVVRAAVGVAALAAIYLVFALRTGASGPWQPAGYRLVNALVAFRWTSGTCPAGAAGGCWHALFVARRGCAGDLSVTLGASRDGVAIGDVVESAPALAPMSPVELEFDPDAGGPLVGTITNASCS